jgi:hypothetical protein
MKSARYTGITRRQPPYCRRSPQKGYNYYTLRIPFLRENGGLMFFIKAAVLTMIFSFGHNT